MMLNCLIIDDEPLARKHIENYVSRVPYLKLVGSVRNPMAGKTILNNEPVDLIFLDIKMPQMTGLDFIRDYSVFQQVILVTAFPEYAIEGFDVEATDYLMKPVTFERFFKAVEKARAMIAGPETMRTIKQQPDFLYIKHNQRYEKLLIADILFIESMLNYINIYTETGKYTIYASLKSAGEALPKDKFIRVHKSYLVSLSKIDTIGLHRLTIGKSKVPVSRGNKDELIKAALNAGISLGFN